MVHKALFEIRSQRALSDSWVTCMHMTQRSSQFCFRFKSLYLCNTLIVAFVLVCCTLRYFHPTNAARVNSASRATSPFGKILYILICGKMAAMIAYVLCETKKLTGDIFTILLIGENRDAEISWLK